MNSQLKGRAAIVTGAGGGIGSAVAKTFAAVGAEASLADLKHSDELVGAIGALGCRVIDVPTDVTRSAEVKQHVDSAIAAFRKVDILVNVAGTTSFDSAQTLDEAEWDRVLTVNLKGAFLCCQSVIDTLRRQNYGRIINIGSILGKNGGNARPWHDRGEQERAANIAYGASKAGVHSLTLYLAKELASDNVTVNAVALGPIASEMTKMFSPALRNLIPVGRMGTAQEVANACLFLASDGCAFVTGEILDVNGGMWGD